MCGRSTVYVCVLPISFGFYIVITWLSPTAGLLPSSTLSLTKSLISCIITCIITVPTVLQFQVCFCLCGVTCHFSDTHRVAHLSFVGLSLTCFDFQKPKPTPQPVTSLHTTALNRTRTSDVHFCCISTGFQCPWGL